jgi:hypothetical protein
MAMKALIARAVLRWQLRRFLQDADPLNRLLGQAIRLQFGQISDEEFRQQLDDYYAELDRPALMRSIGFDTVAEQLNQPRGYKVDILGLCEDASGDPGRRKWDMWARRFGLLRQLGVRADVLILRKGEQVPPHGHYRVVSGFCVLAGEVAVRHYDRVREVGDRVLVRKVLDTVMEAGGFTTNSEYWQNIHWLYGLSPISYLFRLTVLGTPTQTFGGPGRLKERVYVDPTGVADSEGLIAAPYIEAREAEKVQFIPEKRF